MSRPSFAFLIDKLRREQGKYMSLQNGEQPVKNRMFLNLCWPNFFSNVAAFNYNGLVVTRGDGRPLAEQLNEEVGA